MPAKNNVNSPRLSSLAQDLEDNLVARSQAAQFFAQLVIGLHALSIDFHDHVASLKANVLREAAWIDCRDERTGLSLRTEMPRVQGSVFQLAGQTLRANFPA